MQNQLSWQRLEGQGNYPSSREGHTFTYCPALNCYLLFGGIGTQRTNETHSFNVQTSTWKLLEIVGKLPPERNAHVAWVDEVNNVLYVHGGQSAKRDSLADLQALNINSLSWARVYTSEQQPSGRTHHALATSGGLAYVFGGLSGESLLMDDVWSFAYKDVDWTKREPRAPAWIQQVPSGRGPRPRKAHSMVSYQGDLYVFGGITSKGHANDLYQLRLAGMCWRHVKSHESVAPTPRAFHSAALFNDRYMVVFGGIQSLKDSIQILDDLLLLDMRQMDWTMPFAGGILPSSRYGHALAGGRDPTYKQQLVLVGGLDRTYCVMEVYCLEEICLVSGQKWTLQEVRKAQESAAAADQAIMNNRKRIKEIESILFSQRDKALTLEVETEELKERLQTEKRATSEQSVRLAEKIGGLREGNRLKVGQIRALEQRQQLRDDRTEVLKRRATVLEEVIKRAETLLITLDSSFNEVISRNSHPGFKPLTRGKLDDISERKKNHQECLLDLRRAYENESRQLSQAEFQIARQQKLVSELAQMDRFARADEESDESLTEAADLQAKT